MTAAQLRRRATDGQGLSLSAGQIAGIVIGIVVACALLAGLLIWRLVSFKTNRDFFTGRKNNMPPASRRKPGHIRSTRRVIPRETSPHDDYYDDDQHLVYSSDEKRLSSTRQRRRHDDFADEQIAADQEVDLSEDGHRHAPAHKAYDMGPDEGIEAAGAASAEPSPSNAPTRAQGRTSRWWPYGKVSSVKGAASNEGPLASDHGRSFSGGAAPPSSAIHGEITIPMHPDDEQARHADHADMATPVGGTDGGARRRSQVRSGYRQGCTTQ